MEHIIKYLACENLHTETLDRIYPNANKSITTSQFADLLRVDNEAVARKVQMYLPSHNPTCYKYNTCKSKVCRFYFPQFTMPNSEIDSNRTIWLRRDNVWVNRWNPAIASLI